MKQSIVYALWLLIPAMAIAGAMGMRLAKGSRNGVLGAKGRRMPLIAANGLLILLPSALWLNRMAQAGDFGSQFLLLQGIELLAGATNLWLLGLNMRDGLRLSGRLRRRPASANL